MHGVEPADIPRAAATLARAFADDPVLGLLFGGLVPEPPAARFFATMATLRIGQGHVYATEGFEAAAMWGPPGGWSVPFGQIVRRGPSFVRALGWRLPTSLRVLHTLEKNHPTEPHYYLEFIGTDPAAQGKGFGSQLIRPMMERCDREGVGAYLESSKESNVAFYSRYGFDVTDVIHHRNRRGPRVPHWLMWRNPR